ncbi:hypothetical protein KQI84_04110 [bacterium]|nr:hypothetical protein [bacterium]
MRLFPYALPGAVAAGFLVTFFQPRIIEGKALLILSSIVAVLLLGLLAALGYAAWRPVWLMQPLWVYAVVLALGGLAALWGTQGAMTWKTISAAMFVLLLAATGFLVRSISHWNRGAMLETGAFLVSGCTAQWYGGDELQLALVPMTISGRPTLLLHFQTDCNLLYYPLGLGAWNLGQRYSPDELTLMCCSDPATTSTVSLSVYDLTNHTLITSDQEMRNVAWLSNPERGISSWSPDRRYFVTAHRIEEESIGFSFRLVLNDFEEGTATELPTGYFSALWLQDGTLVLTKRKERDVGERSVSTTDYFFYDCESGEITPEPDDPIHSEELVRQIGEFEPILFGAGDREFFWYNRTDGKMRPMPDFYYTPNAPIESQRSDSLLVYPSRGQDGIDLVAVTPDAVVARRAWPFETPPDDIFISPDGKKALVPYETEESARGLNTTLLYMWDFEAKALEPLFTRWGSYWLSFANTQQPGEIWSPDSRYFFFECDRFRYAALHIMPVE